MPPPSSAVSEDNTDSDDSSLTALREAKEKAEADVQAIRSKLHSAVRKGKAIDAEKNGLLARVLQLDKEVGSLRSEILEKRETASQLRDLRDAHEKLLEELQALREAQHVDSPSASSNGKELHQLQLEELAASHQRELAIGREQLEEERAQLYKLVTQGEAELLAAKQTAGHLQAELLSLQQSSSQAASRQAEQNAELQERVESLEAELAGAYDSAQQSTQRSANLDSKLDVVWQRCQELEELERLRAENGAHSAEAHETSNGVGTEPGSSTTALLQDSSALEAKLQAAAASEEKLRQEVVRLQTELQNLKIGNAQQHDRMLEKNLENARLEVEMSQQNADVMREALQAAAIKIQEAQAAEAQARASELEAQAKAESRDEEAAALRKRVAVLEGQLTLQGDLEEELEAARKALGCTKDDAEALRLALREAEAAVSAAGDRTKSLEQQLLEALSTEASRVEQAQILEKQAAAEALQARQQAAQELAKATETRESAEAERKEVQELQQRAQRIAQEAVARAAAAEEAMEELRAEESARKQRFGLLHSTFAKEKAAMQQKLDSALQQAGAHKSRLDTHRRAVDEAEERARAAEAEVEELRAAVGAAEQHIQDLERLVSNQDTETAVEAASAAAARAEEAERRLAEAADCTRQLEAELAATRQQLAESRRHSEAAESEVAGLRQDLEESQSRLRAAPLQNGHVIPQAIGNASPFATVVPTRDPPDAAEHRQSNPGNDFEELRLENARLKAKVDSADKRVAAAGAVQHARIASLEKLNQELQWQVAMLARDPEAPPVRPKSQPPQQSAQVQEPVGAGSDFAPQAVGFILRYRRGLLVGYFALLHVLLYILLQARSHSSATCVPAAEIEGRDRWTTDDWGR